VLVSVDRDKASSYGVNVRQVEDALYSAYGSRRVSTIFSPNNAAATKAGEPGWAVLVPIYNIIVLLKIAGKPTWWFLLFLVPVVNLVIGIMVAIAVAENFGKSTGFGIGLALLPFVFYPMLGFGDAVYQGGAGARRAA